jgi:molybdenum cofactor biosynthesis enzyme MoaA
MPEDGVSLTHNDKLLSSSEIVKLVELFANSGVDKIRFTGGEPLVRKGKSRTKFKRYSYLCFDKILDCIDIVNEVNKFKTIKTIGMTTNGVLLSRKLQQLKDAGLTHVNISLDTLHEKKFEFIAKRKGWSRVIESIQNSLEMNLRSVKVIHQPPSLLPIQQLQPNTFFLIER